jgi:4-amino-4-deoxy-L-arabinose transferase-like glycosyltransferase
MGLLTALGICAGVRSSFGDDDMWTSAIGVLLAGAAVYSPAYLRWLDSGYLDAALGFFALASVLSLRLALEEHGDSRWLNVCAALAAFLIGSKTSLLPFIAVYGFVLLAAARARKVSAKQTVLTLAILSALAAPWYVRNLVLAGDAIAPVLNILIFGHDGLFTKPEVQSIASDLHTDHGPRAIATLPLRAFLTPDTWDFREYGVSALMLLLYVPSLAVFAARFVLNRRPAAAVVWPVVLLTSMIAYWIFSSTVIRYSLLFYPLLALCCGIVATQYAEHFAGLRVK